MIVDNTEKVKNNILQAFEKYNVSECDDAVKIEKFLKVTLSIAIYEEYMVKRIIDDYMAGNEQNPIHRIWCLGYWLPESFIENLKIMRIINDKNSCMDYLKKIAGKDSIYAKQRIVEYCLKEIQIKYEMLKKVKSKSVEYSFLKNDIILCLIRGLKLINGDLLISYKKIDTIIKELNNNNLNSFINSEINGIEIIIKEFKQYTNSLNRLYLGTWQFSGDFKPLTNQKINNLINYAKMMGIHRFDTALVYGNGEVEKLLGKALSNDGIVLTKIPAKIKPPKKNPGNLDIYYDYTYIKNCINTSCNNLGRKYLDICLLHNWTESWNNEEKIINYLQKLKNENIVKKIGISLPNGYENELPDRILTIIDVIEAPYNSENKWIISSIEKYKKYGIEIILRSLFLQGQEKDKSNYNNILDEALSYNTSVVVGMTTKKQIDENTKELREGIK